MKTFESYIMSNRYLPDGSKIEVEEILVEFTETGEVLNVSLYTDLCGDWHPVKMNSPRTPKDFSLRIERFVQAELENIESAEPTYMDDDLQPESLEKGL